MYNRKIIYPYQNIRSLVHICRKLAANVRQVCSTQLRQACRKRVFRMQITFLAHCSGTQCAPQVCSAQLSRTFLAHNVRRKFAAHNCCALFWYTMCAASLQHTIVAHCSVCHNFAAHSCRALRCSAPHPPSLSPPPPYVFSPPGGVWGKNVGMVGVLQKIKIRGWG